MPPRKIWDARVDVPLTKEKVAEIDDALEGPEYRVDFIREAIDRELQRRKRNAK